MSRFFEALEQAERDRALGEQEATPRVVPESSAAPPGVTSSPAVTAPPPASSPVISPVESAAVLPPISVSRGIDPRLVSLLDPGAREAELYRVLRHLIEQHRERTGLGVLVVTSPGVGDGKTTTAINLAGALAQDPKARVLLIEADLRNSVLAARLGLPAGGRGLVDAILDPQ